jgi:hypothetical protein
LGFTAETPRRRDEQERQSSASLRLGGEDDRTAGRLRALALAELLQGIVLGVSAWQMVGRKK